jgi:hypothetical protein
MIERKTKSEREREGKRQYSDKDECVLEHVTTFEMQEDDPSMSRPKKGKSVNWWMDRGEAK